MAMKCCSFRRSPEAEVIEISSAAIDPSLLRLRLPHPAAGAYCSFEGWVRNHNEGQQVLRLEYEVYEPVARSEGERILAEAKSRFSLLAAHCVHRSGALGIGDCAVWVGVTSPHRDEAFQACRFIIDAVKLRLPIWKKEHYRDGHSGWVNCERCAGHDPA
jgi:molybdopterin synthase catalytic subunit